MHTEGFDEALGASYRLVEKLGRGATGEVWKAVDRRTDEVVAAKLLRQEHTSDQDLVGRFVRERSILTGLRHPHVVAVRDLVVEGDRLAIIMDFVDGGSLRDVLADRGPLPPDRAVAVVAAVLDGLAAAHGQGILHRDLKPDNVLLTREWQDLDPGAVRLTDFGISRMVDDGAGTTTGLMGTPEYMAPELLVTGTCDLSADVYGAGILLYELLAGRTPFAGPGTDYSVAHRHVASVPPPLPVPDAVSRQLDAMLAKDPTARPGAAEAAAGLRRLVPALAGVPALAAQSAPDDFDSARGPMTMVRGVAPGPVAPAVDRGDDDDPSRPSSPDLGTPDHGTMLRPMSVPTAKEPRREPEPVHRRKKRPAWRDPRAIALVVAAVVLLGGAVAYATTNGTTPEPEPEGPAPAVPAPATVPGTATATGLTVSRQAVYDPQTETVQLTLTYAAQNAELGGPFLEVIPGTDGGDCPTVTWDGQAQEQNLPSATGVTTGCAWSIDPGVVPEQGNVVVTATVPLAFADPGTELQAWLDSAVQSTDTALSDTEISSTAYPAQRLQGVEVVAPSRTVSGTTLRLTILPVWPSGPDRLNPLYRSPSVGEPSSLLVAVAGGEQGVRFSDGCSGALAVSQGGLVVTALNVTTECSVLTTVGNITDVESSSFDIVTRGG